MCGRGFPKNLQHLALSIYHLAKSHDIDLTVKWIPREENVISDKLSKYVDVVDGKPQIVFSKCYPTSGVRFLLTDLRVKTIPKSDVLIQGSLVPLSSGNNAFAQSWEGQNNFLVPPVRDIIKVIQKITVEHVKGILVLPLWKSSAF